MNNKYIKIRRRNLITRLIYNKYWHGTKSRYYLRFLYKRVLNRIRGKGRLRILFFMQNLSMWKYEALCDLLKKDSRYNFAICPFLLPWDSTVESLKIEKEIKDYCYSKDYPFIKGIDIEEKSYLPAHELNADIIIYTQPYNSGYPFWLIEKFWKKSLFIYTPYGTIDSNNYKEFFFTFLQNVAHRIYLESVQFQSVILKNKISKGFNAVVTGHPLYDEFKKRKELSGEKQNSVQKKIIWAPHHSVTPGDILNRATFLDYAEEMLAITDKYKDIQFIFRPHPYLKRTLYKIWGQQKTNEYYAKWNEANRKYSEGGDYIELFLNSDGMIHDCCSFMYDYLFADKPVMFLYKQGVEDTLNPLGIGALNIHYIGKSVTDIIEFISNQIIEEKDILKIKRAGFVANNLMPPNNCMASENMKKDLDSLL